MYTTHHGVKDTPDMFNDCSRSGAVTESTDDVVAIKSQKVIERGSRQELKVVAPLFRGKERRTDEKDSSKSRHTIEKLVP